MAYGGLRPAEVRQLRVRDIRPSALFVMRAEGGDGRTKGTKTGASRTVPIIGPLREDLDALPAGGPDDPVIGRAIDWDAWTKWVWRPARARAECDPAPYALRHTFASLLIAEGRTVFEVAQRLGHSTPTLTMSTYGHLFAEAQLTDGQDMEQAAIAARRRAPRLREEREARHEAVLAALPASVDQVTDLTGITPALVHAALASLQARRLIEPDPDMTGAWRVRRRGRPPRTEAA
jgi:hypothetical protein